MNAEWIAKESKNFLPERKCFHCGNKKDLCRALVQEKFALLCFEHWKNFMHPDVSKHIETYEQYQIYDDFMFYMMTIPANPGIQNMGVIRN